MFGKIKHSNEHKTLENKLITKNLWIQKQMNRVQSIRIKA